MRKISSQSKSNRLTDSSKEIDFDKSSPFLKKSSIKYDHANVLILAFMGVLQLAHFGMFTITLNREGLILVSQTAKVVEIRPLLQLRTKFK